MLNINYLSHKRHYLDILIHNLNPLSDEDFSVTVLTDQSYVDYCCEKLKNAKFNYNIVGFTDIEQLGYYNYLTKIRYAIQSAAEYTISIDDDIFIHTNTWKHILDNLNVLDNPQVLFMIPTMSNELPGCDIFIESFCNKEQREELYNLFLSTEIPSNGGNIAPDYNGNEYGRLNNHTTGSNNWNYRDWWNTVADINHHYKGIHPLRLNDAAQIKLAEFINLNHQQFIHQDGHELIIEQWPYITNGMFAIKTDIWRKIILDNSLYVDAFDEVPLNKYKDKHGLKIARSSGYAIHPFYSSVNNSAELGKLFYVEFTNNLGISI